MTHIAALELRHVQRYIFSTNRLLDVIGRSATLAAFADPEQEPLKSLLGREGHQQLGAGAANLLVRTPDLESARTVTATLSRHLRDTADGAHLVTALIDEDATNRDAGSVVTPATVSEALVRARPSHAAAHLPTPSFGMTALCSVSGLPAGVVTSEHSPRGTEILSEEVMKARKKGREWHRKQEEHLLADARKRTGTITWAIPLELDQIADTRGDFSQLAVVHLDINRLGLTLREHLEGKQNPFDVAGETSSAIATTMDALACHLVDRVADAVRLEENAAGKNGNKGKNPRVLITGYPEELEFPLQSKTPEEETNDAEQDSYFLPLRPIVTAGDELTLVCDARIAWSLAQIAMEWWDTSIADLDPDNDPRAILYRQGEAFQHSDSDRLGLTFSIGIAVFPGRSPLTVAYERAAALTEFAKEHRVEEEHAVAWSVRGRDSATTIGDLEAAQRAERTYQPYTRTDFARLLNDTMGAGGLRDDAARNKIKDLYRASESLRDRGAAVSKEPGLDEQILAIDALPLLDLHLDIRHPQDAPDAEKAAEPETTGDAS